MRITKDGLKRIIKEELNKELHSNTPVISDIGLNMVKTAMLTAPYLIVDLVSKTNESQNYNFTDEDITEVVNYVIENIPRLANINEGEDFEQDRVDDKMKSAQSIMKNAKRDKLNLKMKKVKDQLSGL